MAFFIRTKQLYQRGRAKGLYGHGRPNETSKTRNMADHLPLNRKFFFFSYCRHSSLTFFSNNELAADAVASGYWESGGEQARLK
jgi:hypothetical protein